MKIILLYQSRVRRQWFKALKLNRGFNLEIIKDDLMRSYTEIINDKERDKEVAKEIEVVHVVQTTSCVT
jgi:hypothetical protein